MTKRKTKKGKVLVLVLAFAFILTAGFASATLSQECCNIQEACCNLILTKSVDKTNVQPGDTVAFTLKYKNIGTANCTGGGVKIQDKLDLNLKYLGNYNANIKNDVDGQGINSSWYEIPGYNETTNTLTWNAHVVSPGEEGTITFNVKVLKKQECGDFEISNFFKAWSVQKDWQYSNTVKLSVNDDCYCPVCGNGVLDEGEECDDGNLVNGDGCSSTCKTECRVYCGDGIINQANETCDDHNNVNGDGCSSTCTLEEGCNIELLKSTNKNNVKPGDIVTYTLHYKNTGERVCSGGGVKIQDILNKNLNYSGTFTKNILNDIDGQGLDSAWYEIPGYDALTNTLTWNAHVISPNEEGTITFNVKVLTSTQCGDFQIPNYFKAWSNEENWKNSNTVNLNVDYNCPYCGDGNLDAGEECDDGNLVNGDGCSSTCKTECLPYCGDGILQAGEECDDHNNVNGDGCSSECETEFSPCKYNISIRYSYANSFGTGIAINNSEDYSWVTETPAHLNKGIHKIRYYVDNNVANTTNNASITVKLDNTNIILYYQVISAAHYKTLSLDTSNLECNSLHNITVEVKSETNGICTNDSISDNYAKRAIYIDCEEQHYCGDGSLDNGEECDLGEDNGKTCTPAYGGICSYCSNNCDEIVLTDGYCGDGIIQSQEECDDGNIDNGDGCSATCDEEQQVCKEDISIRKSYSYSYGTGIALGFENLTWISEKPAHIEKGIYKIKYYIDNNIANTTNNAHLLIKVDGSVLSEYNYLISKYHSRTLTLNASGFECDSSHKISVEVESQHNILCTQDNTSDNYAERSFIIECEEEEHQCGNGILDVGEECDDGNIDDGDGCSADCEEEHELPRCGDGIINQANETCDDGNLVNNDGCSSICKLEKCGDGVKQTNEQCDDGNKINGDGCSSNCNIEIPYCSDGKVNQANETCDDGNLVNNDGCSSTCKIERCGDGIKQTSEQCDSGLSNGIPCTPPYSGSCTYCSGICKEITLTGGFCGDGIKQTSELCDDGNTVNTDTCRNNCKLPYCGDGIKDSGEQCDDGNQVSGDSCSKLCRLTISGCPEGTICGNITTEKFVPIVWQCGYRIMTDENVQPWRFSGQGDLLYERAGNYLFEGEKFKVDVVVFDKNKIQDVVVDLILDSSPRDLSSAEDAEYSVNCVEIEKVNFDKCNARLGEEEITKFDSSTMQAYECSITVLDSEHMYGDYWLTVLADDKINTGVYDEMTPLWINPFISLDIEGSLIFDNIRPGTSAYSQVSVTNSAEGGVSLDMFITGERWYPAGRQLGRCVDVTDQGVETTEYVNYIPLGAFRYYAENGAFTTRLDEENDNQDYYSKVTRDVDSEGYVNIHPQLNAGFEEAMFDEAEIIQAGGPVVNGEGYRANVLSPGDKMALTFRLNYPEPCYGEFDAGNVYLWGEAI